MKIGRHVSFAAVALTIGLSRAGTAMADPPATTSLSPDKWKYSLFNPAPSDQLRDMDSDRPNKTNTPHTIDAGHLQIESGIFDFNFTNARIKDAAVSVAIEDFRVGVLNDLELNAAVSLYNSLQVPEGDVEHRHDGVGDLNIGGKLNFWGNDTNDAPWSSALAIQPQFKIPTAAHDIGNDHFECNIGFPFVMNLPYDLHLGLETFLLDQRNQENNGSTLGWQNTVSVDRVFFSRYDIYLEYWAALTQEHHTKAQQTIDLGVIFTINSNAALDTGINFGLNNASVDYEWVGGLTVRF